ncbi:stress response protein NST1-like [Tripterygium wilfordii]|uniref:Stress response protein NST1-like n=1 Tax=Tripterygium wilfordii TaxID=458696 RepID=A0A7J7DMA7_TRIWF|nr:stress response protein NST1-like [Tripterygium wilfordii]
MKRKKWSELEEQTLLTKYSDLLNSGTLNKLKTREKKFRPIADHVNSVHHIQDPITFPFKWSWRDVSIKVQNMRHQYLGVKQKIRISKDEFNWKDGEDHWENFLMYKEVFGDVELEVKGSSKKLSDGGCSDLFGTCGDLGFGTDSEDMEVEEEEDDDDDANSADCGASGRVGNQGNSGEERLGSGGEFVGERENGEMGGAQKEKSKKSSGRSKRLRLLGAQVMDLKDVVLRREEKRREREFGREKGVIDREAKRKELEFRRDSRQNEKEERMENWEMDIEERMLMWARRETERRARVERELDEERRRRMRMEEKREEEEMEWKERMVGMQIEHEKAMLQMHADSCQNQMQILGVMARLVCQFFGSANDGLGGALGLPPQVLQNLQHSGGLGDNGKPDANSPSEFM